jgi:threonine/homoserine/homoserine lactone efflux protein
VGYLSFLAWRGHRALDVPADPAAPRSVRQVVISAVLVDVLDPKLTISFVAFLPQVVDDGPGAVGQPIRLSAVFMLVTLLVFAGYGWGAAAVRTHVLGRPRVLTWLWRTFAAAFVALGAELATAER